MLNTLNINLKTDIKNDRPTALGIKLMSQDKNNNQFILRFTNGGEPVSLDNTYTVEILTKFSKSGASRLTSAVIRQDYATWQFDTEYITQDETVQNFVYVRKAGSLVVSADANAFYFEVGLSEIDKDAGRVAEVYDENYQKYLDEFKEMMTDYKDTLPQASDLRAEVDIILGKFGLDSKDALSTFATDGQAKINYIEELTWGVIDELSTITMHLINSIQLQSSEAINDFNMRGDAEIANWRVENSGELTALETEVESLKLAVAELAAIVTGG